MSKKYDQERSILKLSMFSLRLLRVSLGSKGYRITERVVEEAQRISDLPSTRSYLPGERWQDSSL